MTSDYTEDLKVIVPYSYSYVRYFYEIDCTEYQARGYQTHKGDRAGRSDTGGDNGHGVER